MSCTTAVTAAVRLRVVVGLANHNMRLKPPEQKRKWMCLLAACIAGSSLLEHYT